MIITNDHLMKKAKRDTKEKEEREGGNRPLGRTGEDVCRPFMGPSIDLTAPICSFHFILFEVVTGGKANCNLRSGIIFHIVDSIDTM